MSTVLEKPFKKMGARVEVHGNRWAVDRFGEDRDTSFGLDVRRDGDGEYFDFTVGKGAKAQLSVLQVDPDDRHLLLLVKRPDAQGKEMKQRFLCGHDERHWFVAAIPESAAVSTVDAAKEALKPEEVLTRERMAGVPKGDKHKRQLAARKRQGEWFFIPAWSLHPKKSDILKNEPFFRGSGKRHYAQEAFRQGGQVVYVAGGTVLTEGDYNRLEPKKKLARNWQRMMQNADMYVRGKISHPDHATLVLDGWHKVVMNTESQSLAMRSVTFLD